MRKFAWLLLVAAALMVVVVGCGKKPAVEEPSTGMTGPGPGDNMGNDTTGLEQPPEVTKTPVEELDFQTIYFDFDKSNLRSDAKQGLQHNYELMKENPDVSVRIEGNCDERGTVEYNLALGERRARSAMEYLVNLGIAPGRLSVISYGKERPAVMGHNEAAWAKNRRDEFKVTSN
jgi:peptidoglycan-associated lipoprotein